MKKQTYFIIYIVAFLMIITSPFWLWQLQPAKKLNVLIMDKTVPNQSYREHKGLVWILNNAKYFKNGKEPYSKTTDYKGFEPEKGKKFSIAPMPKNLNQYDLIYLTDQYGVYKNDFYTNNPSGTRSQKIYGGLKSSEVDQLEKSLISSKGKTLIAEFNTFASPTSAGARNKISNLLNVDWSGWIGRYFTDLNSSEVPKWVRENYEKENKKWNFTGEGLVFVNNSNYIVVVGKDDLKESGLEFNLTKNGKGHFTSNIEGKYQYWFDILKARNQNEVLADYKLPITKKAEKELDGYGIPSSFPAVIYHQNARYSSYYFSGDYADEDEVPEIYQTKGFDMWKRTFADKNSFYWEAYVPMMKDILKSGLHKTDRQIKVGVVKHDGINTNSKTGRSYIQIQENGKWKDFLIKGVNMGIGKPGYFPGETAITKEEYFRWFKEIGAMNANAIRVYTLHPPQFYEAFYEYNQMSKKPLYLFHGTWVNEENLIKTQNAFAQINTDDAKLEIKNMIDIIHGNANLPARPGHASGVYKYDISKYVLGIIIGTEWDPYMVKNTNEVNQGVRQYMGKYFQSTSASPFENWLAGLMDYAAGYETNSYHWQHSMSFTNWVTTDLLKHPSEPLENEDLVSVDPNHIKATADFNGGLFASYHIYPYYPDFLNYDKKYLDYTDSTGKKNNYAGYLHDLMNAHHMPVLVAEFGVPSSRGLTHKNAYGMNQGFHTEKEQGEIDKKLYQSILSEGYAGGLVFTWQDEWFKRTWNNMDYDDPNRRPYWNNQQTNEQHFGLLGFEPGQKVTSITVDGEDHDWDVAGVKPSYISGDTKEPLQEFRVSSDSGYVYFLLKYRRPVNFNKNGAYILLDSIKNQGQTHISLGSESKIDAENGVDFLIKLTGPKESKIMVDSYYDPFYYQYAATLHMVKEEPYVNKKDNGVFNPIRLALNKRLTIPSTQTVIPFQDYETGALKYGNANPNSKDFNSLTDVAVSQDKKILEVRIPWQLLNIKDPSLKEAMDDLWKKGLSGSVTLKGINVSAVMTEEGKVQQTFPKMKDGKIPLKGTFLYQWNEWNDPQYYERLKESYQIMMKTYETAKLEDVKK